MIAMQYKVKLLDNFDMNIIRKRVIDNGRKTDGFQDLIFKAYLIAVKDNHSAPNGWQKINIGVPLLSEIKDDFVTAHFGLEAKRAIPVY